jgi:flagellar basal body-associated protein FliL
MSDSTATPAAQSASVPIWKRLPQALKKLSRKQLLLLGAGLVPLLLAGVVLLVLGGSGGAGHAEPPKPREVPGVLELDPFVANLGGEAGRFLKCTVSLALADGERAAKIREEEPLTRLRVQDRLLGVLTSIQADELAGPGGREALRRALLRSAREALPEERVEDVYFKNFLFQ